MIDLAKEKLLSVRQVAVRFGVTTKTVYCWINGVGGRALEATRMGGRLVTSEEALVRFSEPKVDHQPAYYTKTKHDEAQHAELKRRYAAHGIKID